MNIYRYMRIRSNILICSIFRVGKRYWSTDLGALCTDDGSSPVIYKDECSMALADIKADYPDTISNGPSTHSSSNRPGLCFIHGNEILWNVHETGRRNSANRQICKLRGK